MRTASLISVGFFTIAFAMFPFGRDGYGRQLGNMSVVVSHDIKRGVSLPVRDMELSTATKIHLDEPTEMHEWFAQPKSTTSEVEDALLQRAVTATLSTVSGLNFEGRMANSSSWLQPDANGAVGATQYVQWVNTNFSIYDKSTGALIDGPVAGNSLWSALGGACSATNNGDPIVQYDKAAARWVFTQRSIPSGGPNYQCVAVSTTSDATGTFYLYAFSLPNYFPDYPKLGVWSDAYYLSINLETLSPFHYIGPYICALQRSALLTGASATSQCFQLSSNYISLLPSDLDGLTAPPDGSPDYFIGLGSNSLNLWQFHVNFSIPSQTTLTGPTNIPVSAFNLTCPNQACVSQPGTSEQLTTWDDRLMYRFAYRNFGSHESLVALHSVVVGDRVVPRWYELRSPGNHPYVYQGGAYAPDSNSRWMGSIAMDQLGDMALGYSVSGSSTYPSIRYTGRLATDPTGTLESENTIMNGSGSEPSVNNWGDYTSMSVDPSDDCTFWYTNEYLASNGSYNWHTRIASFRFSSCP